VKEAHAASEAHDYQRAREKFAAAIDAPVFQTLTTISQYQILSSAIFVDSELATGPGAVAGDILDAKRERQRYATLACELPGAKLEDWYVRLQADMALGDTRDEIEVLTTIARLHGSNGVDESWVFHAIRAPAKTLEEEEAHFHLLEALFNDRWTLATGAQPGWVWHELAVSLLNRGESQHAAEVAGRIAEPKLLVAMRADNRFSPIVQANPEQFDVPRAYARDIEAKRAAAAQSPRLMQAQIELIRALRDAYRHRDALDLADEVLTRVDSSRVAPYDDVARQLPWAMNARADVLERLGRFDEAVAQLERAARPNADGQQNASQAINLAQLRCDLLHPKDALDALSDVTQVSAFGRMAIETVRAQAAVQLNDRALLESSLSFLREHAADGPGPLEHALTAANLMDEAAKVFISRLEDSKQRSDALRAAQIFPETPEPPADRVMGGRFRKMLERPDVKAAIARVGRIERYEFPLKW
jgi:tetratricopeptide (TPR) repeat protein